MATKLSQQTIVIVEISQAELAALIVDKAKAAGYIDFDPTRISIQETDAVTGTNNVIFERAE